MEGPDVRALVLAVVVVLVCASPAAAGVLDPPVPGIVLAPFDMPTTYGPGHRGVDLHAPPGSPVRAGADGTVTFAGVVVDATWVTVDHGTVRTTVGPLATLGVRRGERVLRGAVLGTSARAHGRPAVHWSARRGRTYVDPRTLGRRVASLVPVPARPAQPWWPRTRVR